MLMEKATYDAIKKDRRIMPLEHLICPTCEKKLCTLTGEHASKEFLERLHFELGKHYNEGVEKLYYKYHHPNLQEPVNSAAAEERKAMEKLLDEIEEAECFKVCGGSGDDGYYVEQIHKYIGKQREMMVDIVSSAFDKGKKAVKPATEAKRDATLTCNHSNYVWVWADERGEEQKQVCSRCGITKGEVDGEAAECKHEYEDSFDRIEQDEWFKVCKKCKKTQDDIEGRCYTCKRLFEQSAAPPAWTEKDVEKVRHALTVAFYHGLDTQCSNEDAKKWATNYLKEEKDRFEYWKKHHMKKQGKTVKDYGFSREKDARSLLSFLRPPTAEKHIHLKEFAAKQAEENDECDECCDKMVMSVDELEELIEKEQKKQQPRQSSDFLKYLKGLNVPDNALSVLEQMMLNGIIHQYKKLHQPSPKKKERGENK